MLREMDFIEADKDLLVWAIGSTTALLSYSLRSQLRTTLQQIVSGIRRGQSKGTIEGMLSGIAVASVVLGVCALAYAGLLHLHGWQLKWDRFADGILIFLLPEAAYFFAVSRLWNQRRSAAWGVLFAAAILLTHVVVHHAPHI